MIRVLFILFLILLTGHLYGQQQNYEPGEVRIKFGLPYLNSFTLIPEDESRKTQTGWVGIELALEYQYSKRNFLSVDYSVNGAAEAFGLMDIVGEFDQYASQSISLSNNQTLGRITIGYGPSFAQNIWNYTRSFIPDSIPPSRELVSRRSQSFGLILNSYYRLGKTVHVGLIYRPYFFRIIPKTEFGYEHIISVDLMWRFRIKKKAIKKY